MPKKTVTCWTDSETLCNPGPSVRSNQKDFETLPQLFDHCPNCYIEHVSTNGLSLFHINIHKACLSLKIWLYECNKVCVNNLMLGVILYLLSIVLAMFRLTKCFIRKTKWRKKLLTPLTNANLKLQTTTPSRESNNYCRQIREQQKHSSVNKKQVSEAITEALIKHHKCISLSAGSFVLHSPSAEHASLQILIAMYSFTAKWSMKWIMLVAHQLLLVCEQFSPPAGFH